MNYAVFNLHSGQFLWAGAADDEQAALDTLVNKGIMASEDLDSLSYWVEAYPVSDHLLPYFSEVSVSIEVLRVEEVMECLGPLLIIDLPEELRAAIDPRASTCSYEAKDKEGVEYLLAWQPTIGRLSVWCEDRSPCLSIGRGETLTGALVDYFLPFTG